MHFTRAELSIIRLALRDMLNTESRQHGFATPRQVTSAKTALEKLAALDKVGE